MGNKYRIHAGTKREGSNAVAGFLEKGRNDIIAGKASPVTIKAGTWGIPNGTQAWGIRLDKDGKQPQGDKILRVEDDGYRGIIKWLKWGDPKGTMIRARYIPGYTTIDKDYQDTRLGVKIIDGFLDGGDPVALITMPHGYSEIDEQENPALVQMLRIHHQNPKSTSCNPENDSLPMFFEVEDTDNTDEKSSLIETKGQCLLLVSSASNKPENIRTLFDIVKDANDGANVAKEDAGEVYKFLQAFADTDPKTFSNRVNGYKTKVSGIIEKARAYDIFDLTKDGFVAAGVTKKEIILEDVPAKNEGMLEWVYDHCLEPIVHDGISKLQSITDTLK
jgi:hypothetical protein